jgi:transposase-like protein
MAPRFTRQIPEVVGIFPNEAAVTRLIGTLLLEQNDEWAVHAPAT